MIAFATLLAFSFLSQETVTVNAVLSPEPDIKALLPLSGRKVDPQSSTVTIDGKTYEVVVSGSSAALIDPEIYSQARCLAIIDDMQNLNDALRKRDATFQIAESCPALVQLLLITHNERSVAGVGRILIAPRLELTLERPDQTEFKITLSNEETVKETDPSLISGARLKALLNSNSSPYVKSTMALHVLSLLSMKNREDIQTKAFAKVWESRRALNDRYIALYQDVAARMVNLNAANADITSLVNQPVSKLTTESQAKIAAKLSRENGDHDHLGDMKIKSVSASLVLESYLTNPDGRVQLNYFSMPPVLP